MSLTLIQMMRCSRPPFSTRRPRFQRRRGRSEEENREAEPRACAIRPALLPQLFPPLVGSSPLTVAFDPGRLRHRQRALLALANDSKRIRQLKMIGDLAVSIAEIKCHDAEVAAEARREETETRRRRRRAKPPGARSDEEAEARRALDKRNGLIGEAPLQIVRRKQARNV